MLKKLFTILLTNANTIFVYTTVKDSLKMKVSFKSPLKSELNEKKELKKRIKWKARCDRLQVRN